MNRLSLSAVAAFTIVTTILSGCQATKPQTSSLSETSLSSQSIQVTNRVATGPTQLTAQVVSPIEPVVSANDAKAEKDSIDDNKFTGWNQPSGGEYPKLAEGEQIWIDVSISKQRVDIKDSDKTLYTMVTSSGLDTSPDNSTPLGTYYIQPERGIWFYNNSEQEGAKYYVSWKNHGEFLFHSVAMDKNGKVIEKEAEKLGHKASHGCFRLTTSDAKWIYEHIPIKTKVVIHV